jgi:uncharacterized protein (DUF342 family)
MAKRTRERSRRKSISDLDDAYVAAMGGSEEKTAYVAAMDGSEEKTDDSDTGTEVVKKAFGDTGAAWMIVEVSGDGQEALLSELSFGGDSSLSAQTLGEVLKEQFLVTDGINEDLLVELASRAAASPGSLINGRFPVARGVEPSAGEDGRVEFVFTSDLARLATEVQQALEQTELAAVLEPEILSYAAAPGEHLAWVVPPAEGAPGKDVFGNRRTVSGAPAILKAGPFVEENDNRFSAQLYGYVCVKEDVICIVPPIWVAPDRLEAYFIWFPQVGKQCPQSDWLMALFELKEIRHGIDETSLEKLTQLRFDTTEKTSIRVAQTSGAVVGVDAHVEYTFNPDHWAGEALPDGSIDLRERNAAVSVKADELLGELKAATKGSSGMDVTGEELATTNGKAGSFKAGSNVREETEGDDVKYYSEIDGNVQVKADSVQVNAIFIVIGDVDYDTGNIDAATDVQIFGSVRSGFTVKGGANVTVGGIVEAGATISAQGDIIVAQGVLGDTTKMIARGNIAAKFIQNASVLASGDIIAGSYIFNGHVRAGGQVSVQNGGGDRGGSIVGGEVFGTSGVEAKHIGSVGTDRTVVGVGANPEDAAKLRKFKEVIDFCGTHIVRLMRTLGLKSMDGAQIKSMIQQAPPAKRTFLIDAVKKLNQLVETRQDTEKSRDELQEQVSKVLSEAQIKVTGTVHADVQIHMGENKITVSEEIERPLFSMTQEGIRNIPQ